ncbi:MAG: hypothetical protein ABI772_10985 [Bacteroidota bacterium]
MSIKLNKELIELVKTKSILNKDVTDKTFEAFSIFKKILLQVEKILGQEINDDRLKFKYNDNGTFEAELKVGDDILIFLMFTNALIFEANNAIYKSGYVSKDPSRATCGMISIYNFLSDSFKYERRNDIGFLLGRIFINKENHFFMEGKKQLGVIFNDFANNVISEESVLAIIEKSIQYSVDLDLNVPSFDLMKEISVHDVLDYSLQATISSGKRLGFKFENNITKPEG